MIIDSDICLGCEVCLPYCPVGAIHLTDDGCAWIDRDECVECGVCLRSAGCPVDAFVEEELEWPRSIRATFSNPLSEHKETRIPGRGTEEMKTNDVTGRYQQGEAGVAVELGRPGVGASFRDIDKVTRAVAELGVRLEPKNPVTLLLADQSTGRVREDVLDERVLSAIVEFTVRLDRLPGIVARLRDVAEGLDTVFSLNVISKVNADCTVPTVPILHGLGLETYPNGKNNAGLGRPLAEEVA
jgi:Fe-S-cluster-containing dehydrogenase component